MVASMVLATSAPSSSLSLALLDNSREVLLELRYASTGRRAVAKLCSSLLPASPKGYAKIAEVIDAMPRDFTHGIKKLPVIESLNF